MTPPGGTGAEPVDPDGSSAPSIQRVQISQFSLLQWDVALGQSDPRATLRWLSDGERCVLAVESDQAEARPALLLDGAGTTRVTLPEAALQTIVTFTLSCVREGAPSADWTLVEGIRYPARDVVVTPPSMASAQDTVVCVQPPAMGCSVDTPLAPDTVWAPTDSDGCSTTYASQSSPVVVRCEGEPSVSADMAVGPTILHLNLDPPARAVPGPIVVTWRSVLTEEGCLLTLPDESLHSVGSDGEMTYTAGETGRVTLQCGAVSRELTCVVGPEVTRVDVDIATPTGALGVAWSAPGAQYCDIRLAYRHDERVLRGVPPTGERHLGFVFDAPGHLSTDVTCRVGALAAHRVTEHAVPFIEERSVQVGSTPGWQNVCFVASGVGDGACRVIIGADWYYPLPPVGCVEVQTPSAATVGELSCDAPTGFVAAMLEIPGPSD